MKRLIDQVEPGSGMERLTELVNAAETFRPNPFTKRRVLLRLQQKRDRHRPLLKSWAAAAGLLFFVGSAVAGTGWWRSRVAPAAVVLPSSVERAPGPPAAIELARPALAPQASQRSVPREVATAESATKTNDSPAAKTRSTKRRASALPDEATALRGSAASSGDDALSPTPPTSKESGEDPTPVVRAIRALRSERNPAQAESLLQEYLRSHPRGALAEDALALLIETASAMRNPSAVDRATRYLELYPNGRYRVTARRVLASRP